MPDSFRREFVLRGSYGISTGGLPLLYAQDLLSQSPTEHGTHLKLSREHLDGLLTII